MTRHLGACTRYEPRSGAWESWTMGRGGGDVIDGVGERGVIGGDERQLEEARRRERKEEKISYFFILSGVNDSIVV